MSSKKDSTMKKFIKGGVVGLFLLILAMFVGHLVASQIRQGGSPSSSTQAEETATATPKKQQIVQDYLLQPGKSPVRVTTNGKKYSWKHWRAGANGQPILLIRFVFLSGEVSAWENISGDHLSDYQLPAWGVVKAVEFGVPRQGMHQKVEIAYHL